MRILKTYGGEEYFLEDDEAENIVKLKNTGSKAFIELRCGDYVDVSAISGIKHPPLVAMAHGRYPVSQDGKSYMRDGGRVWIEDFSHVKWLPDPKYSNLPPNLFQISAPKEPEKSNQQKMIEKRSEESGGWKKTI